MSNINRITVQNYWDGIASRDVDAYLSTFADDAVAHDPYGAPPLSTRDARRAYIENLLESLPELRPVLEFVCCRDDRTAVKWSVFARSAAGQAVVMEGIDIYRHAPNGRIVEMWGYFDAPE